MSVTDRFCEEWAGQSSAKFTTWKAHVPPPTFEESRQHPLFFVNQRKHYSPSHSPEFEWRSSKRTITLNSPSERHGGK